MGNFIGSILAFTGGANTRANVHGNMQEKKLHIKDMFIRPALDASADMWAVTVPGTADSIAIEEVIGGGVLVTTGTADNDSCMMSTPIVFNGTKKAIVEAKIKLDDVSGTALFFGLSDAKSEANGSIAIHYPDDVLTTVATDAAGIVVDADHATSSIMCAGVKNDTDATAKDTGIDWADGETKTLRVELDGTTAKFFVDGVQKGTVLLAVTAATLLCATVQAATRAADGSNTVHVQQFEAWLDK